MTYFIAASLPEGHPAKEEVVRILRKFKIRFDGSTNPERVKNFIDLQSVASSAAVTPRENAIGKATKPIRAVYRIGFPSTSAASASTSREVLERAPVEQMERFGQSPPMATDGNECFDQEDDDEDDPLQHILKVCNKRAEQIEQQRSLGKVMVAEERRLPMNGYAPAEVKQEEGIADVIEGETKPPVLNQEEIEREDEPLVVKEEEPEAEDDVMDVPPEDHSDDEDSPMPSNSKLLRETNDISSGRICIVCGQEFHRLADLRRHYKTHTCDQDFKCKKCGLSFKTGFDLKIHRRSHRDEKFSCEVCGKTYVSQKSLLQHAQAHRTSPQIECDVCGKKFYTESHVARHKMTLHRVSSKDLTTQPPLPEKPATPKPTCTVCGEMFKFKYELHQHFFQEHKGHKMIF